MASTDRQRWARVLPGLAWKRPGIPTFWCRVFQHEAIVRSVLRALRGMGREEWVLNRLRIWRGPSHSCRTSYAPERALEPCRQDNFGRKRGLLASCPAGPYGVLVEMPTNGMESLVQGV